MSTEIYLARHGQSQWNADTGNDRFNGRTDIDLTEAGHGQAQQMARALNDRAYLFL